MVTLGSNLLAIQAHNCDLLLRCSHCRALAPTWEVLAKVMYDASDESEEDAGDEYGEQEFRVAEALDVPVVIAKVRNIPAIGNRWTM